MKLIKYWSNNIYIRIIVTENTIVVIQLNQYLFPYIVCLGKSCRGNNRNPKKLQQTIDMHMENSKLFAKHK